MNSSRKNGKSELQFYFVYVMALTLVLSTNFFSTMPVHPNDVGKVQYNSSYPSTARELESNEAFSACILIMDDNHRLTEWLAYHYHVLPLRYVVVGVDPNSKTSPSAIFDKWRGYGMTIIEWNNTDIFKGRLWQYQHKILTRVRRPHDHRQRQNMFARNCLVHMKEANRTWVMLIDSDEYLVFNGPEHSEDSKANFTVRYPSVKVESSMVRFLKRMRRVPAANMDAPCISVPRMLFGAVDSPEDRTRNRVPVGFDPAVFDTLLYRKHFARCRTHSSPINGWAKSIIDVSRVRWDDIPTVEDAFKTARWQMNIHQPMPKICPLPYVKDHDSLLRINHYVGSWKAFSFRPDARILEGRNHSVWQVKANQSDETDDNIRPWLEGFVDTHGIANAKKMLRRAGIFEQRVG